MNSTTGGREEANGVWWVEDRDVAQHPTVPRMVPNKENWLQTSVALRNPTWQEIDYIMSKPPEEKEKKPPLKKKQKTNQEKSAKEKLVQRKDAANGNRT